MIHTVIDTNIYRKDVNRKTAAFQLLMKLGKGSHVQIHIPYFVQEEFLSQLVDKNTQNAQSIITKLDKLLSSSLPTYVKKTLSIQRSKICKILEEMERYVRKDFSAWVKSIDAKVHNVKQHHGREVAKSYFLGDPPFSSKKQRKDFPDAFIFQCIIDLVREVGCLYVITDDGNLCKACEEQENIIVLRSLDDFIKLDIFQSPLRVVKFEDQLSSIIITLKEQKLKLEDQLFSTLETALAWHNFSDNSIPSDDHDATISSVYELANVEFSFDNIEHLGGGVIQVPFGCRADVEVDYYIFKSDYYTLSDEQLSHISVSEYDNRHYYEAQERLDLSIDGILSISFDLSFLEQEETIIEHIDILLDESDINVDSIDNIEVVHQYSMG